ncbi:MAG: hypothetical protein JXD22_11615 [Sedimentisphaerales bacterium]|nr:hypothetical protein [Sedimentisphaerales bacterium]
MVERKKRTDADFSEFELHITHTEEICVHYLKKPGKMEGRVKFINTNGILAVTGDYGNWIFCREFRPSKDGHVSEQYWKEKLRFSSTQSGSHFSSADTRKVIESGLNGDLEEWGYEGSQLEQMKAYYQELLKSVDLSEGEYVAQAFYDDRPSFLACEDVPFEKETDYCLLVVFDAFEDICDRIKEVGELEKGE